MKTAQFVARAVLFDWDGTLLNSYEADLRAYLSMFHALGINWTERELAQHYSPNWLRVYEPGTSGAAKLLKDLRPTRKNDDSTEYLDTGENVSSNLIRIYVFSRLTP